MVRGGIRFMLESENDEYQLIITEAETGEDAIEKLIKNDFDIVLMDYQLPNLTGAETTQRMLLYKSETKILALSNYDEYSYITEMLNAGAKGYVLKNIGPEELTNAIEKIINGGKYYSNDVSVKLIHINSSHVTLSKGTKKHRITKYQK